MTSKTTRFLTVSIIAIVITACVSSNVPQKLDSFVDKTELNCDKYDADDWQKSMLQYDHLVKEFNKPGRQYTEAEKQVAARAMGRYHSLLIKNGVELTAAYLEELKAVLPSYLEGLANGLDENSAEIEKSLERIFNSEELEKAFSSIGEKMEEFFNGMDKE